MVKVYLQALGGRFDLRRKKHCPPFQIFVVLFISSLVLVDVTNTAMMYSSQPIEAMVLVKFMLLLPPVHCRGASYSYSCHVKEGFKLASLS